jgi:hypothetical protein
VAWLPCREQEKSFQKGVKTMKHSLKIRVSKEPRMDGIISCKGVTIREKLLRFLFGDKRRVTVLIPGDSVGEIAILDSEKGGNVNGPEKFNA